MMSLLKISWLNMWGFISRVSVLFQLAICLLYFSTSLVLISVAFYTLWSLSLPTLFLFFKVFKMSLGLLNIHMDFCLLSISVKIIVLSISAKKCSWYLDRDFFDFVFGVYYHLNNIKSFWSMGIRCLSTC